MRRRSPSAPSRGEPCRSTPTRRPRRSSPTRRPWVACPTSARRGIPLPLRAARLLSLGPGSRIFEHRDPGLGIASGEARVHVPIRTNPGVEFLLDNRRVVMGEGEVWYLDLSLPHRDRNRVESDRVHLVVDCVADDWLLSTFPAGDAEPSDDDPEAPVVASGPGAFTLFREVVLGDPDLQRRLHESSDPESARPWSFLPRMDLILMRNAMIYFDVDTKKAILGRLAIDLPPPVMPLTMIVPRPPRP